MLVKRISPVPCPLHCIFVHCMTLPEDISISVNRWHVVQSALELTALKWVNLQWMFISVSAHKWRHCFFFTELLLRTIINKWCKCFKNPKEWFWRGHQGIYPDGRYVLCFPPPPPFCSVFWAGKWSFHMDGFACTCTSIPFFHTSHHLGPDGFGDAITSWPPAFFWGGGNFLPADDIQCYFTSVYTCTLLLPPFFSMIFSASVSLQPVLLPT